MKKHLKKISWLLTVSIILSVFACFGAAVPALADSGKVYSYKANQNIVAAIKSASYTATYGTNTYDGSEREWASFTLTEDAVADYNSNSWNKMSIYGIRFNTYTGSGNWEKFDVADYYDGGYIRVWIKSPVAMDFTVSFQEYWENGMSQNVYHAVATIGSNQAGKLSYVDVPISSFRKSANSFYNSVDKNADDMQSGAARAFGSAYITCRYDNTVWISAGQTIEVGNIEIWDGVPTEPAGGDNSEGDSGDDEVTYGTLKDKVTAIDGIISAEKSGQFTTLYAVDASYNGATDMTAATFTVSDNSADRQRAQVNPRSEAAGWKNWYISETENYLRFWVKADKAVTFIIAPQDSVNYATVDYTYSLKTSETGKYIAVDIPVSHFSSLMTDTTSNWRFNKFYINVRTTDGEKLSVGDSFVLGQIELWTGVPTPVTSDEGDDTTTYTVTTTVNGAYGTATGGGSFAAGESAHLLADAASGYHFVKWIIGDEEYTENPLDYTVNSDVTAQAVFEADVAVDAVKLLSIPCVKEYMSLANGSNTDNNGNLLYWDTPEYYDVTTKTYVGSAGKFTVLENADMSAFYNEWGKSRTSLMYTIDNYGAVDFASYASTGVIRVWARASKAMSIMVGIKDSSYAQYTVNSTITKNYAGKFIPIDIPFTVLAEAGWDVANKKAVQIVVRRTDDATADNGYYLIGGESLELGAAEIWTAVPEVPDLSNETHTVTVEVNNEAAGTVSGAGEYDYGKTATLSATANSGYEFVGWLLNGKLISDVTTDITVNCDKAVKAIFKSTSESTVTFKDVIDRIVDVVTVKNGKTVSGIPAAPNRYGYSVTGWKDFSANTVITADTEVLPAFEKTVTVIVTAENGKVESADTTATTEGSFDFEEIITATSTAENFAYWSIDGVKVSTANPYTFYAASDVKLTAVCDDSAQDNTVYMDAAPKVVLQENGKYSITFIASTDLADGVTVTDAGFIMASGDQRGNASAFVIDSAVVSYNKIVVDTDKDCQFMLTITDIPEKYIRSVRAYAIVDVSGTEQTLYSTTIVKAKAADATEETVLDNMVLNSTFLNSLDEDAVSEFCENGWYYQPQNNDRLIAAMQKANAGETVTLAFLGGSITTGSNSGRTETSGTDGTSREKLLNAWHRYVLNWWETTFPQATINYVVAGEAGTGSTWAVYRMKYQILQYQPDVVFNDSAANEGGADLEKECYESVLRAILSQDNAPAVVDLGMAFETGTNSQSVHKTYCTHYGVPIISFQDSIKAAISAGQVTWDTISNDNVHPNMDGHKIVGDLLNYYLATVYMDMPNEIVTPDNTIPEALTLARFSDAEFFNRDTVDSCDKIKLVGSSNISNADTLWGIPDMSDQPDNHHYYSNQARNQGWKLNGNGAYMEVTVTGREAKVRIADSGNTTDKFEIYVDGVLYQTITGDGSYAQRTFTVWENTSGDSTHTIKIVNITETGATKLVGIAVSSWNG